MHTMHLVLLALGSLTLGMPTFSLEAREARPRGLINLSPVISPKLNLGQLLGCLGIGVSVCNPINVNGTQNSGTGAENSEASSNTIGHDDQNCPKCTPSSGDQKKPAAGNSETSGLINIAPVISPDISLSRQKSCIGVGVSVCDPINVGGVQNSNN